MNFFESLRVAFVALFANKLRSLLTMLGVIIGVGSVIIMVSIVQGARQQVVKEFQSDGADLLFAVYAPKRDNQKRGAFDGLRLDDVRAVERRVGSILGVSPEVETQIKAVRGKSDYSAKTVGVTPGYLDVNSAKLGRGRFISAEDNGNWAKVCVIGVTVGEKLFDKADPLGQQIVAVLGVNRVPLTIIGIMEKKGKGAFGNPSVDEQILVPLSTVQKRLTGSDTINSVTARATPGVTADTAADEVFAVLKSRHPETAQDFVVDTQEGLISRLDSILIIFQLILGGVGGLSLLVGGIGIMNIMLVSVTERTREIGIRKAVGAKRGDILLQFVTESMAVSGLGGLLGVAWGFGMSQLIGMLSGGKLATYVPLWAAGMGFGFAVGVGMFFGIYPAVRASRLDPIVALRYE